MSRPSPRVVDQIVRSSEAVAREAKRVSELDNPQAERAWEAAVGDMAVALTQFLAERPQSADSVRRQELFDLIVEAARIFGSADAGFEWLASPNQSVGGATPASLVAKGPDGVRDAREILGRLEHGVYS